MPLLHIGSNSDRYRQNEDSVDNQNGDYCGASNTRRSWRAWGGRRDEIGGDLSEDSKDLDAVKHFQMSSLILTLISYGYNHKMCELLMAL
ncbi:predicted protein [Botrytis cinerea T4]|uniref:Uncharacterized protein n=1 Tax=Botryotinia fuckeliana (strain T4) TaxID=999810 RepID=G2XVI1_BOTF4|nr:predicted protein [Botrytis cinerea T4]